MTLIIGFAFLAGIVTILSPCILPILPIILSGSAVSGKKRPWGIVTGFVASFTFFTLFLTALVRATGISHDALRSVSVIILFLFGLGLLIPQAQVWLERLFSKLASRAPCTGSREGWSGGLVIGLSLGLVWTPCVGPILASVISLALSGTVTGSAILITLAYALGTALPMLAITYGGRTLLQKVPWLTRNAGNIQKIFGVLMIIIALAIHFNWDRSFQSYILEKFPSYGAGLTAFEDNESVKQELERLGTDSPPGGTRAQGTPMNELLDDLGMAPSLIPGGNWFNTEPLTLADLRGKVVLVDFWTYSCINCIRTLPYLKAWHEKYADKGLVIIGVHAPEFEFEKNSANVQKAIADFGISYPVMQDNDFATWRAYHNRYWPAKYFIDQKGRIRFTHFGEGAYDESEKMIQKLLEETGSDVSENTIDNPSYRTYGRTPETYLGAARIEYLTSPETVQSTAAHYSLPKDIPLHHFAYEGEWTLTDEYAAPAESSRLVIHFDAKEIFLVARVRDGSAQEYGQFKLKFPEVLHCYDDPPTVVSCPSVSPESIFTVTEDRLYQLASFTDPGEHTFEFTFLDDNLELYAFTFG